MQDTNISMVRGDTFAFGFHYTGLDQDLDAAEFTVTESYDGAAVVQKTIGDGISKVSTGTYRVRVAPADTASLECKPYYYACRISVNGDVFTILKGALNLQYNA